MDSGVQNVVYEVLVRNILWVGIPEKRLVTLNITVF